MAGRDGITYTVDDDDRHQDVRCLIALPMGQGRERQETIRKDRRVPNQKNNGLHHLELLNKAAHH
jgi:hypothetical protein